MVSWGRFLNLNGWHIRFSFELLRFMNEMDTMPSEKLEVIFQNTFMKYFLKNSHNAPKPTDKDTRCDNLQTRCHNSYKNTLTNTKIILYLRSNY